ncbi:type III pantothenate kinase [Sideroxyarcus emersonii]|uniref:Type III pantothenate kinase n=1 Tax=Sideroxyarcus emersonii TaxID=2764705 RepID=A0AAN2BXY4_9PROT|nr:type III pantothenate kinase [Sideroxyarcus emersonii]BCK86589.1 type III pantothenate kinase [Sideroxyarcus emersonii]
MLLLDVGNSRCKWALVRDGKWLHQGVVGNTEWVVLQHAFAALPTPARVLASNVAGEAMAQCIRTVCNRWTCPVEFVTARAGQCGVRNGYEQPERLGSDRWAALIAARHHMQDACLVVNCGTATTIDALSAQGEFLGGLILPGVSLMQRSLATNTAQLAAEQGMLQDFPRNTADAIHSGMLRATLGAVRHQFGLLQARGGPVRCLLGGGAADVVQPHLGLPAERMDNLVLQGLQIIGETEA